MGLFDAFKKKAAPPPAAEAEEEFPELRGGMKVEVLTRANALIFVGKLVRFRDKAVEIRAESMGVVPRAIYNQKVKLRCFQRDGDTYTLNGVVAQNNHEFWCIEQLEHLQSSENRSFFRLNTLADGSIRTRSASKGKRIPCKVLDISAGGARVQTERLLTQNEVFDLEAALLPTDDPFCVTCRVMRVMARPTPGSITQKYEYGCQFEDVPPREQERLLQSIFTLQRKVLQARRDSAAKETEPLP